MEQNRSPDVVFEEVFALGLTELGETFIMDIDCMGDFEILTHEKKTNGSNFLGVHPGDISIEDREKWLKDAILYHAKTE